MSKFKFVADDDDDFMPLERMPKEAILDGANAATPSSQKMVAKISAADTLYEDILVTFEDASSIKSTLQSMVNKLYTHQVSYLSSNKTSKVLVLE